MFIQKPKLYSFSQDTSAFLITRVRKCLIELQMGQKIIDRIQLQTI